MRNEKFVPYDDEDEEKTSTPPLHPRQASIIKSHIDKPPLPEPRLSAVLRSEAGSHSDLTTVTELSGNNSTFLRDSLTPSPTPATPQQESAAADQSNNDSINMISLTGAASPLDISESHVDQSLLSVTVGGAGNVSVGSVDTPLKNSNLLNRNVPLSPDTPIRDAVKAQKIDHHDSIVET